MQIEKDLVWDQRLLSVFLKLFFSIHFITTDVKAIGLRSFNSVTFSFFLAQIVSTLMVDYAETNFDYNVNAVSHCILW